MLTFDLLLYTVMSLAITDQPRQKTNLSPNDSVFSEIVESFDVQNSTMEEALQVLRQHDFANILIGFEKIAHREGERSESLSLSTKRATVGEILDQLCQHSKQYTNFSDNVCQDSIWFVPIPSCWFVDLLDVAT
jgi:hypothetical protein